MKWRLEWNSNSIPFHPTKKVFRDPGWKWDGFRIMHPILKPWGSAINYVFNNIRTLSYIRSVFKFWIQNLSRKTKNQTLLETFSILEVWNLVEYITSSLYKFLWNIYIHEIFTIFKDKLYKYQHTNDNLYNKQVIYYIVNIYSMFRGRRSRVNIQCIIYNEFAI